MSLVPEGRPRPRLSPLEFAVWCAGLGVLIGGAAVVLSAILDGGLSQEALVRAAVSGGVCWASAVLALTASWLGNRWHAPVHGLLVGMLFRMGLPLAAIVALPRLGGPLAPPRIATTILGVYFVTLVLETAASVRMVAPLSAAKAT
jgi:hypothetical protein